MASSTSGRVGFSPKTFSVPSHWISSGLFVPQEFLSSLSWLWMAALALDLYPSVFLQVGFEDGGIEKVPVLFDFIRILLLKAVHKRGLNSLLGGRFVQAVQV